MSDLIELSDVEVGGLVLRLERISFHELYWVRRRVTRRTIATIWIDDAEFSAKTGRGRGWDSEIIKYSKELDQTKLAIEGRELIKSRKQLKKDLDFSELTLDQILKIKSIISGKKQDEN